MRANETPRKSSAGLGSHRRGTMAGGSADADAAALSASHQQADPNFSPRELDGSPGTDTRLLSTKLENEWLVAIKEEEFAARESELTYESEKRLRALQIQLKKEQDMLVHKTKLARNGDRELRPPVDEADVCCRIAQTEGCGEGSLRSEAVFSSPAV